jgi:hypothetical protein
MSGELYVDDGLDPAVNIDRSSFRESDEAFIELQAFLFEKLKGGADEGSGIFTAIKAETKKLAEVKRRKEEKRKDRVVARSLGSRAQSVSVSTTPKESSRAGVKMERDSIVVSSDILSRVPRKHRKLFVAICGIIERQIGEALPGSRRRNLYEALSSLFEEF